MTDIAIDMDDVCIAFSGYVLECLEREYGVVLNVERIKRFEGLGEVVEAVTGIPGGLFGWLRDRDWLWAKAPAMPGAIGGIRKLREAGHHIELLTKKPEWAEWCVWAWLGKWRPLAHTVTIVPSGACKAEFSTADILVDDSMDNIVRWMESGRHAIVYDRPWNRVVPNGLPIMTFATRVLNWTELLRYFEV